MMETMIWHIIDHKFLLILVVSFTSEAKDVDFTGSSNSEEVGPSGSITLTKKQFGGRYAITSEEFTSELVRI